MWRSGTVEVVSKYAHIIFFLGYLILPILHNILDCILDPLEGENINQTERNGVGERKRGGEKGRGKNRLFFGSQVSYEKHPVILVSFTHSCKKTRETCMYNSKREYQRKVVGLGLPNFCSTSRKHTFVYFHNRR